ncbi:hypothetical protein Gocc_2911 [Gaiella occulta]|uniref:Uncharacterized protein n=1 Tax=Gaiella occulta TaxID=1002870 RepID=A0A7M2YT21_9ACTN|nr:hypothetical protein [Gaiella occulta]RDI73311.1 hypothetical protein Gocc_2911 [Gaiella occulta]
MPTTVDCVQIVSEETPRPEGAATTAPYRLSSGNVLWLPGQTVKLRPNPQFLSRDDELRGIEGAVPQLLDHYEPDLTLKVRAYPDLLVWLLQVVGLTGTYTAGGATTTDANKTTATGVNALNSAVVNVASTADFPASGTFIMGGVATAYTGKTATSFTGCGAHAATVGGEAINGNAPTGTNKWVFGKRGGITAKTFQALLAFVDEGVFLKGQGCGLTQLGMDAEGNIDASGQALVAARVADPNLAPAFTTQAVPHFRRGDLSLSWLTGSGTTENFSFLIANQLTPRRTLSLATPSYFPDVMEHGDDKVKLTGAIPKTVLDPDDYDALVAASTWSARARWQSPKMIGATSYPYTMWIEMPACQYTDGEPDDLANKRRFGQTLNYWAAWDEAAGYDFRITLVNGLTSAQWETLV